MDLLRVTTRRLLPTVCQSTSVLTKREPSNASQRQRYAGACSIHTSRTCKGLMEFFDLKDFDRARIPSGRPWRKDELRIKSNEDLHKLWYVLLKERNQLLTMLHMYQTNYELIPNPERIFKVENSMENIQAVVKERNIAADLLEKGDTEEIARTRVVRNAFGIPYVHKEKEHVRPKEMNEEFNQLHPVNQKFMEKHMPYYEEKLRKQWRYERREYQRTKKKLMDEHDVAEEDVPEFEPKNNKLREHLNLMAELNDTGDRLK